MTSVDDLLAEMRFVSTRIEAIPTRFQCHGFRPSSLEVAQIHDVVAELIYRAEAMEKELIKCAIGWTADVYLAVDDRMSRIRPTMQAIRQGQIKATVLRRNLVTIFQGT